MKQYLEHDQTPVELIASLNLVRGSAYRLQAHPDLGGIMVALGASAPTDLQDGGYLSAGNHDALPEFFEVPVDGGLYAWAAFFGYAGLLLVHESA